MKRPKTQQREYTDRIAGEGAKAARLKFEASRKSIRDAMKAIADDVEKNGGVYLKGRKITLGEVLSRAGKRPSYLNKTKDQPDLIPLKQEVKDFVGRMTSSVPSDIHSVHRNVADRARAAQAELDLVRQVYSETELELSDAQTELRDKSKTIEELEARIADLLKELAGRTVVDLPTRRK
jgi:hypothetical protein